MVVKRERDNVTILVEREVRRQLNIVKGFEGHSNVSNVIKMLLLNHYSASSEKYPHAPKGE